MATTLLVVKNRAHSKLAAAITAGATSLTVTAGEGAKFPSTYPFHLTIDDEIVSCTNRSTDTLTIARAQQGTSAAAHANNSKVALNITAKSVTDLNTAVNTIEDAYIHHDGSVAFTGTQTFNAPVIMTSSLNVAGAVEIGAPVLMHSSLGVAGTTTLALAIVGGGLYVAGIANLPATIINSTLGVAARTTLATVTLGGKLTAGSHEIEGSNFDINGGDISACTISGNLTWNAAQTFDSTITISMESETTATNALWISLKSSVTSGDLTGVRSRVYANADSAGANVRGGYFEAKMAAVSKFAAMLEGALIHADYSAGSATISGDVRGLTVHISQGSGLDAANLYGILLNIQTRGDETIGTDDVGLLIRNEAVGGNGREMGVALKIADLNMGGGTNGFDVGISFAGITCTTAEIDLDFGKIIFDQDGDTDIHCDSDDELDFKLSGSNFIIMSTGVFRPGTTNQVDLGSSAKKFKDLYLAGNASIGGTLTVGADGAGHTVTFYGDTAGSRLVWYDPTNELYFIGAASIHGVGTGALNWPGDVGLGASLTVQGNCAFQGTIVGISGSLAVLGNASFHGASVGIDHSLTVNENVVVLGNIELTGTLRLGTTFTGVIRADSGVLSVDTDVTDLVTAASTTAAGIVELAIGSEVNTGTSTTLAVTPDALDDWTGSAQITTVGTLSSGNVTAQVTAATLTAAGKVELATAAEINTGDDTGRAVAPKYLSDSNYGKRIIYIKVLSSSTALITGDGKAYITIPIELTGMNLILAHAAVYTTSSGAAPSISLERSTDFGSGWNDMLSTDITIDASEYSSYTAGTAPVINGSYDDVATGNWIRVNIDTAGTGTTGLDVILTFQLP